MYFPYSADAFDGAVMGDVLFEGLTNKTIRQAVCDWCSGDLNRVLHRFGPIASWDVSQVTNMSGVFFDCDFLTNRSGWDMNISGWDMTNVVRVSGMFGTSNPLSYKCFSELETVDRYKLTWNLKNVTDINKIFSGDVLSDGEADLPSSCSHTRPPLISELITDSLIFNKNAPEWDTSLCKSLLVQLNDVSM
jgi:hypothetical protein